MSVNLPHAEAFRRCDDHLQEQGKSAWILARARWADEVLDLFPSELVSPVVASILRMESKSLGLEPVGNEVRLLALVEGDGASEDHRGFRQLPLMNEQQSLSRSQRP